MTTDTALIEKREELKRRLAAGEYKTLVDVLLNWASRVIQKITRSPQLISPWINGIILCSCVWLATFIILLLMDDIPAFAENLARFPQGTLPLMTLLAYFTFLVMVGSNLFVHRLFTLFYDSVIDEIESISTLNDFENWLASICNRRVHFIVGFVGGVLAGSYVVYVYTLTFGTLFPLAIVIGFFEIYIVIFLLLYLLFFMTVLSARLGNYHLKLYTADPGNSEMISQLASLFSRIVYLVALYAAFFVFVVAFIGLLIQYIIMTIFLFWIPLTILFVLYQGSLSSIVRRAKWETLKKIQGRVEKLQIAENFGDKETMDAVNRLMDYHDRVNATRNSALDFRAYFSFINSLVLPLLAFVLGNLDLVLKFFTRQP